MNEVKWSRCKFNTIFGKTLKPNTEERRKLNTWTYAMLSFYFQYFLLSHLLEEVIHRYSNCEKNIFHIVCLWTKHLSAHRLTAGANAPWLLLLQAYPLACPTFLSSFMHSLRIYTLIVIIWSSKQFSGKLSDKKAPQCMLWGVFY